MRPVERWHFALGVALVAGAVLWLALVPNEDPSGNARNPAYWWLCAVVAFALGAIAASNESALVGAAVAVPALVMAAWSAPRGDGDGLWVLWFPILAMFVFGLAVIGAMGGSVGRRLRS